MIKIIKGTYGYKAQDSKVVRPWTEADGPLSLTEAQEARLVGLGVAEYVHEPDKAENGPSVAAKDVDRAQGEKLLEEMNVKELRELAKEQYGLSFRVGTTKADMIAAIQAEWPQETEAEAGEDDGEEPPEFDPAEAVE